MGFFSQPHPRLPHIGGNGHFRSAVPNTTFLPQCPCAQSHGPLSNHIDPSGVKTLQQLLPVVIKMDPKGQPGWKDQTQPTLNFTTPTSQRTGLCLTPVASLRWSLNDFGQTAFMSLILPSTAITTTVINNTNVEGDGVGACHRQCLTRWPC